MNYAGLLIPFSIWLALFVYKFAVAGFLRRKKSQANDEDLISQQLDDILISIISRLPTKEAVRSSILSNRWRNLYKSVPDIKLECVWIVGTSPCYKSHFCLPGTSPRPRYHGPNEFINAVDRFLRLRSGFKIRKLNLKCCSMEPNTALFEQFICSLGRLDIEGLRLTCSEQCWHFAFSCHLISRMPSLKSLYLFGFRLDHKIPPPLILNQTNNSLQVLKLTHVVVADGTLGCILSNCLSLHALKIVACAISPKLSICGPRLRLESLCIRDCWDMVEIELYASNLVSFEFQSSEIVNFRYEHVPKLQTLFINFRDKDTMPYVCTKLARDLPNLKSLVFSECGIYQFSAITMGFNMFKYLRQLSIHLLTSNTINLLSLAPFLQMCPLLQEFHLETVFSVKVDGQEHREVRRPDAVIHSELKKVEIIGHCGTKSEIEFALYILKSAMCVEQMRISRCRASGRDKPAWSKKTLEMIHSQLQGKAISKNARLTIQHSTRNCVTFPVDGFY